MAQAARRVEQRASARRQPPLRAVKAPRPAGHPRSGVRGRAADARARALFAGFVLALVVLVALGSVRVALIVRATEMSISETQLQARIKAQRVESDQLEVDRSSLSTPSRIAGIASATMSMGKPRSVRYLTLSSGEVTATPEVASQQAIGPDGALSADAGGMAAVLGAVLDMSAGEAQSLLVGELGLAGSR